jgi:DNA-binding NarL/FixJ family response regulator
MKILLADDQAKVRSALRLLLEHEPGMEILGEAVDVTGLLDWLKAANPDVLVLDWKLPGLPAVTLLPQMRSHRPHLRVVALSGLPGSRRVALAAGVDAFVSKGDPPEVLVRTVHACSKDARITTSGEYSGTAPHPDTGWGAVPLSQAYATAAGR